MTKPTPKPPGALKTALGSQMGGPAGAQAKREAEIECLKSKVTLSELKELVASVLRDAESQAFSPEVRAVLPAKFATKKAVFPFPKWK